MNYLSTFSFRCRFCQLLLVKGYGWQKGVQGFIEHQSLFYCHSQQIEIKFVTKFIQFFYTLQGLYLHDWYQYRHVLSHTSVVHDLWFYPNLLPISRSILAPDDEFLIETCINNIPNCGQNTALTIKPLIQVALVGNKIVDLSDVVGAPPVGAAPASFSFSTQHQASMDWAKAAGRRDEKH